MSLDNLTWGRELCDMTPAEANEINRRLDAYPDLLAACRAFEAAQAGEMSIGEAAALIRAAIEKAVPTGERT